MDLRAYYQQLRETEASIPGEFAVVVSNATPDGGKAGVRTEATRAIAARLIVESRARLATAEEAQEYYDDVRAASARIAEANAASRLQVTVISESELRSLRERARPVKD